MEVTSDNHVAIIVIAAVVGLIWSILMIVIRIFLRIVGVVQTSVTLHAVHNGIGKQEDLLAPDEADTGLKTLLGELFRSLSQRRSVGYRNHGTLEPLITVIAWYSPHPTFHQKSAFVRWTVVETGNMLIELLIPGLIIMVLWNLQARFKTKITILVAFSAQLLVAIPTIFRLILLHEMTTEDIRNNRTFAIANTVVLTEITMHFSLMAATFPCLRKFLQAFDTNMGATTHMITDPDDPKHTGSNGSYGPRSLDQPSRGKGTSFEHWSRNNNRYNRKYQPHTVTTVSAGVSDPGDSPEGDERLQRQRTRNNDMDSGSVESDDSQLAIIRRTQHWEVTVELRGN
ncbi:hypothetical protein BDV27DRAFT_147816 [Aspergillus caelatus]|uniref:Rhodopsin domain-containing protein n=1 Tax=Aspergillus caelatus TaxID=61420 RepID=A0A5N6ZVB7_9EURO|nr:uncharacterized protein BDV27DRAFT_147816 [Aspergillus caelatus]KAE8361462.1 hypothetical protein BDV27DRAFT_147816 [Aspergillus caelatus]